MKSAFEPATGCRVVVIVVTHNSRRTIQWCLDGLDSSTSTLAIRIVDSGSSDSAHLDALRSRHRLSLLKTSNVGFVAGNNLALDAIGDAPWVLFLNPDARIEGGDLDALLALADEPALRRAGIVSVPLVRFDIDTFEPLAMYDSVGIGRTWYGRWTDLLSGQAVPPDRPASAAKVSSPDAVCGALMLIRSLALMSAPDSTGAPGFERTYFMYKEDIELSLRVRRAGWTIAVLQHFHAYHCRGWNKQRQSVPRWARVESARNDVDIALSYSKRSLPFALAKWCYADLLERSDPYAPRPSVVDCLGADFDAACMALATQAQVGFDPDLWLGIETGGARVLDRMRELGGVGGPCAFVEAARPSTRRKQGPWLAYLLRRLPRPLADAARIAEHLLRERGFERHRRPVRRDVSVPANTRTAIEAANRILLVDDAIDSGSSVVQVIESIQRMNPRCSVKVAVIAQTFRQPLREPDFVLRRRELVRFPWSADAPK